MMSADYMPWHQCRGRSKKWKRGGVELVVEGTRGVGKRARSVSVGALRFFVAHVPHMLLFMNCLLSHDCSLIECQYMTFEWISFLRALVSFGLL